MRVNRRFLLLITLGIFSVAIARAQKLVQEAVPNWTAPETWSPASVSRGVSTMGAVTSPLPFIGLAPCRIVDTRGNGAPIQGGMFTGGADVRNYAVAGICGIPALAQALSLNFTVVGPTGSGFLLAWPTGGAVPPTSILNFNAGDVRNNAAVVPTSASTSFTVNVSAPTHVIIDINGYYAPAGIGLNTFVGLNAGNFTMTGDFNTGFGHNALFSNTTGSSNSGFGDAALAANTTGCCSTATGTFALANNTTNGGNTATGFVALNQNTTGFNNTATGSGALQSNTTGSLNIAMGFNAGNNLTTGSNNICIGNLGVAAESSAIRIGTGGTHTATFLAGINGTAVTGVPVLVSGSGQLGVASSSRYVKEDIREIASESDGLMKLRPVAFRYQAEIDPTGLAQYGLIAEEVAEVYPDLVVYDHDGRPETVRYQLVNALLLNELQKQHRTTEAQKKTDEEQEKTIEVLKARLSRLEARLLADSRP